MEPGSPAVWPLGRPPEQAAPRAAEVCSRWRACTRLLQFLQRPIGTEKRVVTGRISPRSTWNCSARDSNSSSPPQSGQHDGRGASSSRSTSPVGAMRWPWRPWASPLRLPGFAGSSFGSPLEKRGGLALSRRRTRRAAAPALRHGHHARQGAPHARPSGRSAPGARRCWPREAGEAERSQRPNSL